MEHITKSQVKLVRSLQQKKFRDELGLFVAEGDKCVSELAKAFELEYLIVEDGLTSRSDLKAVSHLTSPLYRNLDTEFTKSLHSERRIPVDILFRETEDGFSLRIGNKEQTFVYPHEPAKNENKALDTIRTQLSKLGDTPYIARDIRIESAPYFIPISILNEWRRNTII